MANWERQVSIGVIWIVKVVVLLAIAFETANVGYSIYEAALGGAASFSSTVYSATEGALFLLALLDLYASMGYLPEEGSRSLVMVMEAGLAYVLREIIIQFRAGNTDSSTLVPIGFLILALGATLYISSKLNRDSDAEKRA